MQNYNNSLYKIPANTLFMGKRLIYVPECHSTNDEAQRLSQVPDAENGTIVITDLQTSGRGQRGNSWIADPGKNLTFSVLLKPAYLPVVKQAFLTMAVSLGIYDWLKEVLPLQPVCIKWPNDILVDNRKVCGILIENHVSGDRISQAIIGVGVNINQSAFPVPFAASLKMFSGNEYNLADCFERVVEHIESRYVMLANSEFHLLKATYLERLYWLGETHIFASHDQRFAGIITGVDEFGNLEIEINGFRKTFGLKEISYIR